MVENYVYWTLSIALKDFPGGSDGKASAYSAGDPGSIRGSGRSPGEGNGNPLQYSWTSLVAQTIKCLPTMWEIRVRSLGREDLLEKEMATHSSTLAWKIPWTEEPGRLQSMGSQKVGHDWATSPSFSSNTVQRHQFFGVLPSLQSSYHNCTWPLGRP